MNILRLVLALCVLLPTVEAALTTLEIRQLVSSYGMQYLLLDELQRPLDPRLEMIEQKGIEGCSLFKGKLYPVYNTKEIIALSGKLSPGDQLVLMGTDWQNAQFTFAGHGTAEAPILIRPDRAGSVVFSGSSAVAFEGAHLIITGLEFRNVAMTRDGATVFRLGVDKNRPADNCIVNRITIEDCNSQASADWPRLHTWYLTADYGRDNTVANSTFAGRRNIGEIIGVMHLPPGELLRLHILNNHFKNRPKLDDQDGYEAIQIGQMEDGARSVGALIQGNTFEYCDGENEIITLKGSDIVVRNNTFAGCQGVLSLRTARRVLVQGNVFESRGRPNTGGVRMQGWGHVIIENIFRDQNRPQAMTYWPVSMMTADNEEYGDKNLEGYGRSKHILIARNRFEHCENRIAVGVIYGPGYPLLPKDIQAHDNVFVGVSTKTAFEHICADPDHVTTDSLHESGNQFLP